MIRTLSLLGCLLLTSCHAAAFTLHDQHGRTFHQADLQDTISIVVFGYTFCPDVCPDSLHKLAQALESLGALADQVQAIFISLDPERDSHQRLRSYARYFSPKILALRGSLEATQQAADAFGVHYGKHFISDDFYTIEHSSDTYLTNHQGQIIAALPYGVPSEHISDVVSAIIDAPDSAETDNTTTASFTLQTLQDQTINIDLHDSDTVLLNFWASWCAPCRDEIPALNQVWRQLGGQGLRMIAINVGETKSAVRRFLQDFPIEFTVALDPSGRAMEHWSVTALPTTLLWKNGDKIAHIVGERAWSSPEMLSTLSTLLQTDAIKADPRSGL